MYVISFSEAVKLKKYIWEHFKYNLHIHDTCGGSLFFSLEEVNEKVTEFVIAYLEARGIQGIVSKDGKSIFIGESIPAKKVSYTILFEADHCRSVAYMGTECIGECTYVVEGNLWDISHTYVKEEYRSLGIAKELVDVIIREANKAGVRLVATCSYAKEMLG